MMTIYSVLLVEDEIGTRQALCEKILAHPNLSLYGAVGSCEEASRCMTDGFDVLLTDLGLPDGNGISLVQQAKSLSSPVEIMVMTTYGDESNVIACIEAGASNYLLKDLGFDRLGDSVFAMMQGESSIDPRVARFLISRFNEHPSENLHVQTDKINDKTIQNTKHVQKLTAAEQDDHVLSNREIEVLELVSKGLTYAETGHVLSISENTIRAHIRNIYTKLAVNSRFEAVYEATVMGLIKPLV